MRPAHHTMIRYGSHNDGIGGNGPTYLAVVDTTPNGMDAIAWMPAATAVPTLSGGGFALLALALMGVTTRHGSLDPDNCVDRYTP